MRTAAAFARLGALLCLASVQGCDKSGGPRAEKPLAEGSGAPAEVELSMPGDAEALRARVESVLPAAVMWKPRMGQESGIDPYLAPLLYREVTPGGSELVTEPPIGGLVQGPRDEVLVIPEEATLYFADDRVEVAGARRRRLTFVWFHAVGPRATPKAQGLRNTFAADGQPMVYEPLAGDSGVRVAFVARSLEEAARAAWGPPLAGRRHAVEGAWDPRRPLVVARVVGDGAVPMGPFVYQRAGSANLVNLHCRCEKSQVAEITDTREYALRPLAELSRLGLAPTWPEPDALAGLRLPPGF